MKKKLFALLIAALLMVSLIPAAYAQTTINIVEGQRVEQLVLRIPSDAEYSVAGSVPEGLVFLDDGAAGSRYISASGAPYPAGTYYFTMIGSDGTTEDVTLVINPATPPETTPWITDLSSGMTINKGESASLWIGVSDPSGLVTGYTWYKDGAAESYGPTCPVNSSVPGTFNYRCIVNYSDSSGSHQLASDYVQVTVRAEKIVSGIDLYSKPNKTRYAVGDKLNVTGLALVVYYTDGTSEVVYSGFECSPAVLNKEGTQLITVVYKNQAIQFDVNVGSVAVIKSISIKTPPIKLQYAVGDKLDTTGLVLAATFSDGSTQDITSGFTCNPTTLKAEGIQQIIVSYSGKAASFDVTVGDVQNDKTTSINVKALPSKAEYKVGDLLDVTGLQLQLVSAAGSRVVDALNNPAISCNPTKLTAAGEQVVTVTYTENGQSFQSQFTVKVEEEAAEETPAPSAEPEKKDEGGLSVATIILGLVAIVAIVGIIVCIVLLSTQKKKNAKAEKNDDEETKE